jgi:hypothetical protein
MTVQIDMTGPHAVTENRMAQITAKTADAIARLLDDMQLVYREVNVDAVSVYGPWYPTEATRKRPKRILKKGSAN